MIESLGKKKEVHIMDIKKIVLTGGPCAGKSMAVKLIKETFSKKGVVVLFVPEAATELISGGVCPWTCGTNLDYQIVQCKLQRFKEQMFDEAVRTMKEDKFLIVCDRGMLDNKAYMSDEEFEKCLETLGTTEEEINASYDAVFHMVSTAKGLKEFYIFENNVARYETPEQAAALDDVLIKAWSKHPNHKIIENSLSVEDKMNRLMNEIGKFLGIE